MADEPLHVLFLCTSNSARSQMAEAILRQLSANEIDVHSAGNRPGSELDPMAKAILEREYRIDTNCLRPKPLDQFLDRRFDYVITVCDRSEESCPVFPGDPQRIHWSFEDPEIVRPEEDRRRAFERVAAGLAGRLRIWLSLPEISRRVHKH